MKKLLVAYSVLVAVGMAVVWGLYFATGTVMGVKPEGAGIGFHIAAEFATGLMLLAAAVGMARGAKWGKMVFMCGMGMLFYALIGSPGYYLRGGGWIVLALFGGTLVIAAVVWALGLTMKDE